MKKALALLLVLASLAIVMVSCGGDSLIGTWEGEQDGVSMTITFEKDGKGSISSAGMTMDMTWSASDGKLNASMSFMGMSEEMFKDAEYKLNGNKLTITVEGESVEFTKK